MQQIIRSSRYFYIGISEAPGSRWSQSHAQRFDKMLLLHIAESSSTTSQLEKVLLTLFRERPQCLNIGASGEHASHGHPHYLYVVSTLGAGALIRQPCPTVG